MIKRVHLLPKTIDENQTWYCKWVKDAQNIFERCGEWLCCLLIHTSTWLVISSRFLITLIPRPKNWAEGFTTHKFLQLSSSNWSQKGLQEVMVCAKTVTIELLDIPSNRFNVKTRRNFVFCYRRLRLIVKATSGRAATREIVH